MRGVIDEWLRPVPEITAAMFILRCSWIVIRLIAVYLLANQVSPFFYQRF
jgi:hypothetical protein